MSDARPAGAAPKGGTLPDVLTLVPNSGIQFVEYGFHIEKLSRFQRPFFEREFPDEVDADGQVPVRLLAGWDELNPDSGELSNPTVTDRVHSFAPPRALEAFLGKWVPVPYIAHQRLDQPGTRPDYRNGPTNWARVRVEAAGSADSSVSHSVVFAFDTAIDDQDPPQTFTTPARLHTGSRWEYSFVSKFADLHWFIHNPSKEAGDQDYGLWVWEWVERLFQDFKREQRRGRPPRPGEEQARLEALARYFTFLELLGVAVAPRKMRFSSDAPDIRPVEVDLVLDVGNSRSYGILIERVPDRPRVDLTDSYTLKLRDLQSPTKVYSGTFESHVELFSASFGDEDLSRLSGRSSAFLWPSAVRVGPEAGHIRESQVGNEGFSGLSSPKRYLWDLRPVQQAWRFPKAQYAGDTPPPIGRRLRNLVNRNGEPLRQIARHAALMRRVYDNELPRDATQPATDFTLSRSSLYSLMIGEIVWQAMTLINSPTARLDRPLAELPRRLARIILTLPSATPVREQVLLKLRVQGALELLWDIMGWTDPVRFPQPAIKASWDEASCVQLVWLYGEIAARSGGRIDEFFSLAGRPRKRIEPNTSPDPAAPDEPSLRIATIDIGGGTTDLMITTYFVDGGRALMPIQTFREGIRLAGDDLLRNVIERLVLPAIERGMRKAGIERPELQLLALFGGDRADVREQERHLRRKFVLRVLRPVALGLLHAYESLDLSDKAAGASRRLASFLGAPDAATDAELGIDESILSYIKRVGGSASFTLANIEIPLDFRGIDEAARSVLDAVFDNFCEAIHRFDCDVVLLSGRPSRLPVIAEMIIERLAVAPDRVVQMHLYKPGRWYPLPDHAREDRIGDPKTTAAVGAMLCALSERDLPNFMLYTQHLQMRSVANYIGQLENDGKMLASRVLFETTELDGSSTQLDEQSLDFYTKMRLGFRQLPLERWVASPLYQIWLEQLNPTFHVPTPLRISFSRELEKPEEGNPDDVPLSEARKEELHITTAADKNGDTVLINRPPPPDARTTRWASIQMTFRTLNDEEGYWLDSGILSTQ